MTDRLNPERIAQLLTQSTKQLDPGVLAALSNARQNALQRQAVHAPVYSLATNRCEQLLSQLLNHHWVSAGLLAAILIVGTSSYWHHDQEQQIAELDVAILTDELPIEVFVD